MSFICSVFSSNSLSANTHLLIAKSKTPEIFFGGFSRWWQVVDSNHCSLRDGFTVRSHWPLGQPATLPKFRQPRKTTDTKAPTANGIFAQSIESEDKVYR